MDGARTALGTAQIGGYSISLASAQAAEHFSWTTLPEIAAGSPVALSLPVRTWKRSADDIGSRHRSHMRVGSLVSMAANYQVPHRIRYGGGMGAPQSARKEVRRALRRPPGRY